MDARTAADVMVDVCPSCQAVWIDWFDGAPPAVAAATGQLPPADASSARRPVGACPRCTVQLAPEWLAETLQVYRCGDCAGLLVPRESFDELARLASAPTEPPAPPTTLERVAKVLADVLRMFSLE
jgi:Zn-finger nucleic acid-binding protein